MKSIPFDFVLEQLEPLAPYTKPMFGCTGVYVGEKIVLILRDREAHPEANGIWIATSVPHHDSLREEFPGMEHISIFGPGPTDWQLLPSSSDSFEEWALRACELILASDPRIGRVPKSKLPRKKAAKRLAKNKKTPAKKIKKRRTRPK